MDKKVIELYSNTEFRKNVCVECDDREECDKTDDDIQNCLIAFTPYEVN